MAKILKIHHVAVVVPEIEGALGFWQSALGLPLAGVEDVPAQKASVAFLPAGESEVELVRPLEGDSGLAKFLAEKGPGLHHICFEVDDIDAMLQDLQARGVRLINPQALVLPGRKAAFIHPKAANGVLVELYQLVDEK